MGTGERGGKGRGTSANVGERPKKKKVSSEVVWREARELLWFHRRRLAVGFVLMLINRAAGFVLPWSSKELIDVVIPSGNGSLPSACA